MRYIHLNVSSPKFLQLLSTVIHCPTIGTDVVNHKNLSSIRNLPCDFQPLDFTSIPVANLVSVGHLYICKPFFVRLINILDDIAVSLHCTSIREEDYTRICFSYCISQSPSKAKFNRSIQKSYRNIRMRIEHNNLFEVQVIDEFTEIFKSKHFRIRIMHSVHSSIWNVRHNKIYLNSQRLKMIHHIHKVNYFMVSFI